MPEFFDVVDDQGNIIGKATREECHEKSLLHRTVHILILNSKGEMLIQKRSQNMDIAPSYWTSSAAGHVDLGELPEKAAYRELEEELGTKTELEEIGKIISRLPVHTQLITIFSGTHNGPFKPDNKEIEEIEFVKIGKIKREIRLLTRKFTPGFMEVFRKLCEVKGI